MKGVLPWLVHWTCRAVTRDFYPALAALVGPVQNIFFITVHYFYSFVPIVQQSMQAVMLYLNMCLWFYPTVFIAFFYSLGFFLASL
jgi:hypothetical protein